MESASLYDYNEDELLASIAASVYPNAKNRGVEWNVRYSGKLQLLPHADYLNLIQIISQLIKDIIALPGTTSLSLCSHFTTDDNIIFEIERIVINPDKIVDQNQKIKQFFERMKPEYVGQLPEFSTSEIQTNRVKHTVSFRLRGNEVHRFLKKSQKIVIADTDRGLLSVMADALSRDGFAVAVSEDPTRILSTIETFNPQIVLLSLNLGDQNGLECSMAIRQKYPQKRLLILALLASDVSAEAGILEESGFSGVLMKPRDPAAMKGFVEDLRERVRDYE